jgi:predicted nucleic acid-binding protein
MRLFLDANVLFAASYSDEGRSRALFRLADAGYCEVMSSTHAVIEKVRNVALKAPFASETLEELLDRIDMVKEADPRLVAWATGLGLPANDAPILAAAVAGGVDALVTGDRRHFGTLFDARHAGVLVVSPATALELVFDTRSE